MIDLHHSSFSINSFLKFSVSLFLDGLCILKFLDQFHFKHFHLHNFLLLLFYHHFFFCNFTGYFFSRCVNFLLAEFFNLGSLDPLLLLLDSCLHLLLLSLKTWCLVESGFVLLINEFSLFGFLLFVNKYRVLYLFLLHSTLSPHSSKLFSLHFLSLLFFRHHHLLASVSFLVLHLSFDDIASSPLGLFDLLPSLHFFLFQQGDSIS